MRKLNPDTIAPPIGAYTQAILLPPNAKVLQISGQVGIDRAGVVPRGVTAQAEAIFDNIQAILAAADMGPEDLIKLTAYLVEPDDLPAYGAVRAARLGDLRPCSTLVFVKALVRPDLVVEVEAIAARA
ncbi:MAG: RidA family protein [Pararhodobacter sp.]|nr:RidA family protein [Pararhodobacter sp.]